MSEIEVCVCGGGGGEPGSKQHSGQTSGVREAINSGRPVTIFLRKIS